MRPVRLSCIFGLGVALASTAYAGAASVAPPDFAADRFLVGKWACDFDIGGPKAGREEATYAIVLAGHWLRLEYKSFALGSIGASTTTHAYEGFDRTLHKWVYTSFGSDGGYGTTYSDGWKNSVKIYTPASDKPQVFRLIATKVGDNAFTEEVQVPSPGGTWKGTERGLLRCKRAPVKR